MADEEYHVDGELLGNGRFLAVVIWFRGGTRPYRLFVSTSAERTVLLPHVFAELGIGPIVVPMTPAIMPNPDPSPPMLYLLEGVSFGGYWIAEARVPVIDSLAGYVPNDLDVDGVLGMDWLAGHFDRICFHLDPGSPRLELRVPFITPPWRGR